VFPRDIALPLDEEAVLRHGTQQSLISPFPQQNIRWAPYRAPAPHKEMQFSIFIMKRKNDHFKMVVRIFLPQSMNAIR
jgi:hypothetical protein